MAYDDGTYHGDRNQFRSDALFLLQDRLDDPTPLSDVRVADFEPDHRFPDGQSGPALRVAGEWVALDDREGRALERYVATIVLGPETFLFGTVDADGDGIVHG